MSLGDIISGIGNIALGAWGQYEANNKADADRDMQVAFAKNAVQWKVADAQKAGVHPLYALGAPTMSFSPTSIGGGSEGLAQMGQGIDRAIGAGMPKEGQITAYQKTIQDLTATGMGLDNEYKAAQIARLRNEMLAKPALPMVMPGNPGPTFQPGPQVPAQKVQDQYGDIIENVYGTPSLIYDSFTNLDRYLDGKFLGVPQYTKQGLPTYRRKGKWPSVSNSR